jgi:hypothetical protein
MNEDIFQQIHDHPEVSIFGCPKPQDDACSPRYSVEIIGPEYLMKELIERIDNAHK